MRKKIITFTSILVVVLLTATALVAFDVKPFEKKHKKSEDNYFTKTIDIVTAEKGDLNNTISAKGTLDSENSYELKMPANAIVDEVYVKKGSRIKKGDALVSLNKDSLQDEYDRIYDEWIKAESVLGYMKPSYDYIRIIATAKGKVEESNLAKNKNTQDIIKEKEYLLVIQTENEKQIFADNVPSGKISSVSYLSAKGREVKSGDLLFIVKVENSGFTTQVEKVNKLKEQLKGLKELLDNPEIKAQSDAVVSDVSAAEGEKYDYNTVLLKYKPTDEILVRLTIMKDELTKVNPNQEAKVTLDSGVELMGNVYHISYSPNENGAFNLIIKMSDLKGADANDILPGLKATVEIVLEEKNEVVKVPVDAIKTDNKGEYVLVYTGNAEDQKTYTVDTVPTEKRYVTKGMVTSLYVEIESGISEGEKIVVVTVSKNENDYYGDMMGF